MYKENKKKKLKKKLSTILSSKYKYSPDFAVKQTFNNVCPVIKFYWNHIIKFKENTEFRLL